MKTGPIFTRRQMLQRCGCGFGYLAFTSLFAGLAETVAAAEAVSLHKTYFAPRAKRVIFLFMHGGPSHVDTFDYKPLLKRDGGNKLPDSFKKGPVDPNAELFASPYEFNKCGQSGLDISEIFPE